MTIEEKYRRALDVLERYEKWEADSLNSYGPSVFDEMSDKEYNSWMEIQGLRNEVLTDAPHDFTKENIIKALEIPMRRSYFTEENLADVKYLADQAKNIKEIQS